MLDEKKYLEELLKYAFEDDDHRREIINMAWQVIMILNNCPSSKDLSEQELECVVGGKSPNEWSDIIFGSGSDKSSGESKGKGFSAF